MCLNLGRFLFVEMDDGEGGKLDRGLVALEGFVD